MAAVRELTVLQQRKVAAIVGACVADAATQPLQWIYKDDVLSSLTKGLEEIEFRVPSANPFYIIDTGRNTCYADEAYVVLKSLVESGGLNTDNLTQATYEHFGPESEYENQENTQYVGGKENTTDVKQSLPIHAPWRNGCVRDFLKNLEAKKSPPGSATDDQADCYVRCIPLVALYAGHPDMLFKVEEGLRILQYCDLTISIALAAARVLELFILHGDPENVLDTVITELGDRNRKNPQQLDLAVIGQIRQVQEARSTPHVEAVSKFNKSCHLPGSFQSSLHGIITAASYVDGVRTTMRAGGCSASRSGFIGACLAAKGGFEAIPDTWRSKTFRYGEVLDLALKLVQIKV